MSSIEMMRRNSSPSPLSQVSVTGLPTPSALPSPAASRPCCCRAPSPARRRRRPSRTRRRTDAGCRPATAARSAAKFGSTVSRYCVSARSSICAPLSAIEPRSRGVSIGTRGEALSAASRDSCWPGVGAAPWPDSCGCAPPWCRGRRLAGLLGRRLDLLLLLLRLELRFLLLLLHLRQADEILPRDQHERGEHDGENGVLLVGHVRRSISCPHVGWRTGSYQYSCRHARGRARG